MERRKNPRLALRVRAQISAHENFASSVDAEILDISRNGAFVHCLLPIELGQRVYVRVFFDEMRVLTGLVNTMEEVPRVCPKVTAVGGISVIRWARGTSLSGFGVEFLAMDLEQQDFVERLTDCFRSAAA